jgi:hypothetical protein
MDASNQGGTDFYTGQASVTTTPTAVLAPLNNPLQRGWIIRNLDTTKTLYIGRDSTLTTGNGFILLPGESLTLPVQCKVWMRSSTGTISICWIAPLY